ncbi:MAG: TRAP transporter substrate-binding protein [Gammaproteobacteria bacterium]|nr:TRAP transporter substrate-binding protein [Gammaproteobacteria bacterium]MBT8109872.1 TRAP transporter substrate-binding protein [Gammaproteobacteria bacterium]NND47038.1 TRAP transporter substrate-binding protein [Woeseiaceae bacterium]NNL44574.1 TRAP transporter substrate-binding protein [Woeseiaceae bacterium]
MKRRQFVGGLAAAATLSACAKNDTDCNVGAAASQETFEWSCVTSWPPKFPGLGMAPENLATRVEKASAGRLKIKVYGAGELVPAFEVFDAVSRGTVEMGHDASYYHKGKVDAAQFFAAIPFGMTNLELNGWLYYGGGMALWRELYAPFGLVPFPTGNTGVQMGGWFNKEINTADDLKGLKMRIPGLGGEVLRRAGGTPVTLPGSEIFTALQTGSIDATEWVGPYNDASFGLHKAARYYYYPGWQEPGPGLETIINADAWNSLPADLQEIVSTTCQAITTDMAAEYTNGNAMSLQQLKNDPNVELRRFPTAVIDLLRSIAQDVVEELMAADPAAAKIGKAYFEYLDVVAANSRIAEQAYLSTR